MANFGLHTQNGVYNASDDRFGLGAFAQRNTNGKVIPGIVQSPSTDALVTAASTPNLTVTVRPFVAITTDSGIGAYVGGIDTVTVLPALTPELANNRYDILAWRHLEGIITNSNGETTLGSVTLAGQTTPIAKQVQSGEVYWIKGTPSSSSTPSVPSVPTGSVALARVYVAGGTTAISQSNIVDIHQDVTPVGAVVSQPTASIGASTDLPVGTLVRYPGGILESNGSTLRQIAGYQTEAYATTSAIVDVAGNSNGFSATLITVSQPAGGGLHVEVCADVNAGGSATGIAVGRLGIECSINGGGWSDCTEAAGGTEVEASLNPSAVKAVGYVAPSTSVRSVRFRARYNSAGGQSTKWRGSAVHVRPVVRSTTL